MGHFIGIIKAEMWLMLLHMGYRIRWTKAHLVWFVFSTPKNKMHLTGKNGICCTD
jgi:hypothetical protein